MHTHPEPIEQKILQHPAHLILASAGRQLRHNVEMSGNDPLRPDELIRLHLIRNPHARQQRQIVEPHQRSVDVHPQIDALHRRSSGPYRSSLEFVLRDSANGNQKSKWRLTEGFSYS